MENWIWVVLGLGAFLLIKVTKKVAHAVIFVAIALAAILYIITYVIPTFM